MNRSDELERNLAAWMEAVAPRRAPEHLAGAVVERTRSMRPWPGWLVRLQEPSMQLQIGLRQGRVLGVPVTLVLVALLVIVLAAAALLVGAQLLRPRALPAPFGVAANGVIAVEVGDKIVTVRPDGGVVGRIALPWQGVGGVSFSRDGTRIAGWIPADPTVDDNRHRLVVANVDGSAPSEIDPNEVITEPSFRISWSPDDRHLAFSSLTDQVLVADLDEGVIRVVGDDTLFRRDPVWSPDGRLAYRCQPKTTVTIRLCLMNGDGTGEQAVDGPTPGTEHAYQGSSWSHDGERIAYYIDDVEGTGGWDLAIFDFATRKESVLTRGIDAHTIYPVWAPDGRHVVVLTSAGPAVVRGDGTGWRIIETKCEGLVEPSPDGRFLACIDQQDVVLIPVDGGAMTRIPLGGVGGAFSWQRLAL